MFHPFATSQPSHNSVFLQYSSVNNQPHEIMESYEGMGISPLTHTQNSISLTVGMERNPKTNAAASRLTAGTHSII